MNKQLRVIDFFCGAGGFSEGFRQQGYKIVMGIDNWQPAIETHNLNHNLNDIKKDVLIFKSSIDEINKLPDTEVIIGSPPCVLFSNSNASGTKDKTLGIELIETFLKVIAVKKHQKSSKMVAWFMENVPNSKKYIKSKYTFQDLNLKMWAQEHNINPTKVAVNVLQNGQIINTADFGTPQNRHRLICGEIISTGQFPNINKFIVNQHTTLGDILNKMPSPNSKVINIKYTDPNYPLLRITQNKITDHFYDSGLYECHWQNAKFSKLNHPYMGKMSFPENLNKPSRTIMATKSLSSRETTIYKSEYKRSGDGEYRIPTIREMATLMGFPYSYQFYGSEITKWRQIGNAVCPQLSAALAKSVRISLGLKVIPNTQIKFDIINNKKNIINNLNTFTEKKFTKKPTKKPLSRFRKHPFKEKSITVALTNYNPLEQNHPTNIKIKWYSSVFIGSGKNFQKILIPKNKFNQIDNLINKEFGNNGKEFIKIFNQKFKHFFNKSHMFQNAYTSTNELKIYEPGKLIDEISNFILNYNIENRLIYIPEIIPYKKKIPTKQILAIYAINRIVS